MAVFATKGNLEQINQISTRNKQLDQNALAWSPAYPALQFLALIIWFPVQPTIFSLAGKPMPLQSTNS